MHEASWKLRASNVEGMGNLYTVVKPMYKPSHYIEYGIRFQFTPT